MISNKPALRIAAAAAVLALATTSVSAAASPGVLATSSAAVAALVAPVAAPIADRAAIKHYSLEKKNLALEGYDPVAYFPAYGGKAKKGSKKITAVHDGVLYRFSSEANKKAFLKTPSAFEPMYGGWCAWAMSDGKGDKTEANPKSFTIEDGRLYVFYDGWFADTRKSWKKNGSAPKLKSLADKNWTKFSGEETRLGDKAMKKKEEEQKKKEAEKKEDKR